MTEKEEKIGVLAASGLGDGLLMQIAAHQFGGTLFTNQASALKPLFPNVAPWPKTFDEFDLLIIENDNSARCWDLMKNRKRLCRTRFIFPTLNPRIEVTKDDFVCHRKLSMAENIANACGLWLGQEPSKDNGIVLPDPHRKGIAKRRVVIHPTSRDPKRNWSKNSFEALAKALSWRGFFPCFVVGKEERAAWKWVMDLGFALPEFQDLNELATFMYEAGYFIGNDSGLGHLASNLGLPTLTISGNPKRVKLWRPGFSFNQLATLSFPLPNFKGIGLRMRDHFWQPFVSLSKVLKTFEKLQCTPL